MSSSLFSLFWSDHDSSLDDVGLICNTSRVVDTAFCTVVDTALLVCENDSGAILAYTQVLRVVVPIIYTASFANVSGGWKNPQTNHLTFVAVLSLPYSDA